MIHKGYSKQDWDALPEEVRDWISIALTNPATINIEVIPLVEANGQGSPSTIVLTIDSDSHFDEYSNKA